MIVEEGESTMYPTLSLTSFPHFLSPILSILVTSWTKVHLSFEAVATKLDTKRNPTEDEFDYSGSLSDLISIVSNSVTVLILSFFLQIYFALIISCHIYFYICSRILLKL